MKKPLLRYLVWVESAELWKPLATARLFGSITKSQADAIVADIRKGASSYFPGVKKTARIRVLTDDKRLDLYTGEEVPPKGLGAVLEEHVGNWRLLGALEQPAKGARLFWWQRDNFGEYYARKGWVTGSDIIEDMTSKAKYVAIDFRDDYLHDIVNHYVDQHQPSRIWIHTGGTFLPTPPAPGPVRTFGAAPDAGPTYLPMSERTKNAVLRAAADPGAVLPYAATAPKSDVKPWPGVVQTEGDYEARSAYYREQQESPPRVPEFPVGTLRIGRDGVKVEELRSFRPDELVPSEDEKRGPVVDKYVRWVESGSAVPPLTVLEVLPHGMGGGTVADWQNAGRPVVYQVSDGHHRIAALKKAKKGKRARVLAWVGVSAVKILERTDGELVPHPVGVSLALARELAEA